MESVMDWAQLNFGNCVLGDKRRTQRLVKVAEQFAHNPAASLPDQNELWKDLKAAYRLLDREEVTFAAANNSWARIRTAIRKARLAMAASVVDITTDTIAAALRSTKVRDVISWTQQKLGISLQAQRQRALCSPTGETKAG